MKKKKILITGGAGYLGGAVVELITILTNYDFVVVDNLMYSGYYTAPFKFIGADITDHSLIASIIKTEKPDSIIHLAAIVGDSACQVNPALTIKVNERATYNIVNLCKRLDIKLVFASTCSCFGSNSELLNEDSPTAPLSIYAGTKLNCEKYIKNNLPGSVIFRLGTLFGLSGQYGRIRTDLVANILTFKAALNQPIEVFGGEQWRPILHVKDAASEFITACVDSYKPGMYIISGQNIKIIDLADRVVEITDSEGGLTITSSRFEDLRNYMVDVTKAKSAGFTSAYTLDDGIREMAEFIRSGRINNISNSLFNNGRFVNELYSN